MTEPKPGAIVVPMASDAWIAPNGDFHYVPFYGHAKVAYGLDDGTGGANLEMSGWIHLSDGFADMYDWARITQAQIDTLWDTLVAYRAAETERPLFAVRSGRLGMAYQNAMAYSAY